MTSHHIRILHDTALHAAQTILGVSYDHGHVASNHNLIHHDHAHELIKQGHAEWVGVAASTPPAHERLHDRHAGEHADMLSRHASEHREMRERHEAEHNAAIAAMGGVAAVTGL